MLIIDVYTYLFYRAVIVTPRLTFQYQLYDNNELQLSGLNELFSTIETVNGMQFNNALQFVFHTSPDKIVLINIKPCLLDFRVYDGPKPDIQMNNFTCINHEYYLIQTDYSAAVLVIDIIKYLNTQEFVFKYGYLLSTNIRTITIGESIQLQHTSAKGIILNQIFMMNTGKKKTHLKFDVKTFRGYTGNDCRFGGVMLITTSEKLYFGSHHIMRHGPYCKVHRGQYLLGEMNSLSLYELSLELFIYGYSDYFDIDLKITISPDDCEGILNVCALCSFVLDQANINTYVLKHYNKRIYCSDDLTISIIHSIQVCNTQFGMGMG